MGNERKRSMMPALRSEASATAVVVLPNTTVCTKTPGSR